MYGIWLDLSVAWIKLVMCLLCNNFLSYCMTLCVLVTYVTNNGIGRSMCGQTCNAYFVKIMIKQEMVLAYWLNFDVCYNEY